MQKPNVTVLHNDYKQGNHNGNLDSIETTIELVKKDIENIEDEYCRYTNLINMAIDNRQYDEVRKLIEDQEAVEKKQNQQEKFLKLLNDLQKRQYEQTTIFDVKVHTTNNVADNPDDQTSDDQTSDDQHQKSISQDRYLLLEGPPKQLESFGSPSPDLVADAGKFIKNLQKKKSIEEVEDAEIVEDDEIVEDITTGDGNSELAESEEDYD